MRQSRRQAYSSARLRQCISAAQSLGSDVAALVLDARGHSSGCRRLQLNLAFFVGLTACIHATAIRAQAQRIGRSLALRVTLTALFASGYGRSALVARRQIRLQRGHALAVRRAPNSLAGVIGLALVVDGTIRIRYTLGCDTAVTEAL